MAETVSLRDANQRFARLVAEVEAGKEVVITRRGVPVARLVPERPPDGRRLTPAQERAWAETEAFLDALRPAPPPADLPSDGPRDRDELYDGILRERRLLP